MLNLSRRRVLAAGAASVALAGTRAQAATEIGWTIRTAGAPTLQRERTILALRPKDRLYEHDRVRTDPRSLAELMLDETTRINLGPGSELEIDRFVAGLGGEISLGGAMVFDRPEDLPPLDLTIRSAFARIGVRGTRFFAGPSNGVFGIFVERGSVIVSVGIRALSASRSLGAGEGIDIPRAGGMPRDVARWGQGRIDAAFASVGL